MSPSRRAICCVVPAELHNELAVPLVRFYSHSRAPVRVLVDRRNAGAGTAILERRGQFVSLPPLSLPPVARAHADRLIFVGERLGPPVELNGGAPAEPTAAVRVPRRPESPLRAATRDAGVPRRSGTNGNDGGVEWLESSRLAAEDADTQRLVARFQAGEVEVFARIYRRYSAAVQAMLAAMLVDEFEAEDVTQDVFASVHEALPGYEPRNGAPWRAWLFAIARNQGLNRLEKLRRGTLVEPFELNLQRELEQFVVAPTSGPGWIDDGELFDLFNRLPLAQQQVLTLRFALDRSQGDIGRILGLSIDQVKKLQRRGITALRDEFVRNRRYGRIPAATDGVTARHAQENFADLALFVAPGCCK